MRLILRFAKGEEARYISHLDIMRAMQRAIRRGGLPVKYSEGFNPHQLIAFATALPVGMAADEEYLDAALAGPIEPEEAVARLNQTLPPGLTALCGRIAEDKFPSLMSLTRLADYRVAIGAGCACDWRAAVGEMLARTELVVKKRTKSGVRPTDIRPMIASLAFDPRESMLRMRLACGSAGNLKPELVFEAMCASVGVDPPAARVDREALYALEGGQPVSLFSIGA